MKKIIKYLYFYSQEILFGITLVISLAALVISILTLMAT